MPGHCAGHLCLWEPRQRWLFSGDLSVAADLDSQLAYADGPSWVSSLGRALAMRPAAPFDGHGTIVTGERGAATYIASRPRGGSLSATAPAILDLRHPTRSSQVRGGAVSPDRSCPAELYGSAARSAGFSLFAPRRRA
jgi:glyoxylase-like metal-dependent hydrolase (beta-lactamase superfamily II)